MNQRLTKKEKCGNSGFTLIELAIVVIIGGILIGLLGTGLTNFYKTSQQSATQERLDDIRNAIELYLSINGKLPCVASLTDTTDTATFGREIDTNCTTAPVAAGSFQVTGRAGLNVRIGAVPTRSLNLPDDLAFDAWGNRFTYSVTEALATTGTYDPADGAISMVDSTGNSLIVPADTAHYVLISHGNGRIGGYTESGVIVEACNTVVLDGENCDNTNAIFRNTLLTSTDTGANEFDDFVTYQGQQSSGIVPSGAVMAFNLTVCPSGWTALPGAEGRFIIGTGPGTPAPGGPSGAPANYSVGDQGGASGFFNTATPTPVYTASMPPYLALLYCEKD